MKQFEIESKLDSSQKVICTCCPTCVGD